MSETRRARRQDGGFAMAALLVAMSVMAILLGAALPVWSTYARREKEAELVFRGEQYARAIGMFQKKYTNVNPPSIDVLVKERFLRRKYKDPITGEDFALVTPTTELPARSMPPELQGRGGRAGSGRGSSATSSSASASSRTAAAERSTSSRSTSSRSDRSTRTASAGRGGMQAGATGGIMGVMSKSTEKSFRLYNGAEYYNEWIFMPTAQSSRAGSPTGAAAPGMSGSEQGGRGRAGAPPPQPASSRGRSGSPTRGGFGR